MRIAAFVLVLLLGACAGPAPAPDPALYAGRAIVTGTDERSRPRGIAEAFADVLAKVAGDPRLLDDPRVAALPAAAGVVDIAYRDRMEGIPIHDEQGTRDRPYDMTVRFDPAHVDAVLRSLGSPPWPGPRPRLGAVVTVRIGAVRYVLANAGERGYDQRNALLDAGERRGLALVLPPPGDRPDAIEAMDLAGLDALARTLGADRALAGRMSWSQAELRWTAEWRMTVGGAERRWVARDATFDEAFRRAVGTAAMILAGKG